MNEKSQFCDVKNWLPIQTSSRFLLDKSISIFLSAFFFEPITVFFP